jgi:putative membrane protein
MLIVNAIGLALAVWLLPGVTASGTGTAVGFVLVLGVLNALLWPVLARLTLPFLVFTFGLGTLLLNAFILGLTDRIVDAVNFDSVWAMIGTAIVLAVFNTIGSSLLSIDEDASYYRSALKRQANRARKRHALEMRPYPGVIFLEIDGLAKSILERAVREGHMPTLKRWLDTGSHRLMGWETDTSCQTGGCQAGILHGNNDDIPAFRWVEKDAGNRIMTSSGVKDMPLIEQRHSDGNGLLSLHGYSRSNLFSGDAGDAVFTFSRMTAAAKIYTPFYYSFFSNPYNFIRTISLVVAEAWRETRSRRRMERDNVQPRLEEHHRKSYYPWLRAFTTVFLRDAVVYTIIGDIFLGDADALYATFFGYDEVAHHSGIEEKDVFKTLQGIDRAFGRLERATQESPRPYKFVVLADHGQSQGSTFQQRYGLSFQDFVAGFLPRELKIHAQLSSNESWDHVGGALTDAAQNDPTAVGRTVKSVTKRYQYGDQIVVGPEYAKKKQRQKSQEITPEEAEAIVLASGNLGLIAFTAWDHRMTLEEMNEAFPGIIPGLVAHEGVGFILVDSSETGAVVLGKNGKYFLKDDRIEGENPLAKFGPRAAQHLRRTNGFKHCPDILVNSLWDTEKQEGAAFEELVGFHGGMGGEQSRPFILFPSDWDLDKQEIVGAENVHRALKGALGRLRGDEAPKPGPARVGSMEEVSA